MKGIPVCFNLSNFIGKIVLDKAKTYAVSAHGNQKYGTRPYVFHLDKVVAHLASFGEEAQVIGYLHDVVEDTEISLEEITIEFSDFISQCVGILTDEPGDNRKERKAKTYAKMANVSGELELALIVKVADRLANIEQCLSEDNTSKLSMYYSEHMVFKKSVYRTNLCDELWDSIDRALNLDKE